MKLKNLFLGLIVLLVSCSQQPVLPSLETQAAMPITTSTSIPTSTPAPEAVWVFLSDLEPTFSSVGFWSFSIGNYPATDGSMTMGAPIRNGGQAYPHGLFAHAPSNLQYDLNGSYQTFKTDVFIDPSMVCDSDGVLFQIYLDEELIYSQHMEAPEKTPSEIASVSVDVSGGGELLLHIDQGERDDISCDAGIWGEPMLLTDSTPEMPIPSSTPLEQLPVLINELNRFNNAMRAAGVIGNGDMVSISDVRIISFKDQDGLNHEAALVYLDPDPTQTGEIFEGKYPLLVGEDGKWRRVGLRFWAESNGMGLAIPLIANSSELDDPAYPLTLLSDNATQIVMSEDIHPRHIFSGFTAESWHKVIVEWDRINDQLNQGVLPDGFGYSWESPDRILEVADNLGMEVRVGEIFPDSFRAPQEIIDGQFSAADLEKLYEFIVKTPMIHYRGKVGTWLVATETTGWLASGRGPEKNWGFPYLQLGGVDIIEKAYGWAHEADPQATLILTDDHIFLEQMVSDNGPTQPHWNDVFFRTVTELKDRNVPVNAIDIENNFWVYNPPDPDFMRAQMERLQDLGYSLYAPEVSVLTSDAFPWTSTQSQKLVQISNPIASQALVYQQTLQAYLDLGVPWFGLGGLTDRYSFWRYSGFPETHAMIFDYNQQPKAAYYLLVSTFYTHLSGK